MSEHMNFVQIVVGSYQVNCYVVSCTQTKQCAIIDPGGESEKIVQYIEKHGLHPAYILNTHGHADHIVANTELKKVFNVPVCMHKKDVLYFIQPDIQKVSEKELGLTAPSGADILLEDNQKIEVGNLTIQTLHTPGHTPGSVCYLVDNCLFTGDTLFVGDVGRTDLSGGSLETLLQSIEEKILPLPNKTTVLPGHDYGETPTSTIGWEKEENPYITDFILAED